MSTERLLAFLMTLVVLTGCGGPRAVLGLGSEMSSVEPAGIVPIYVATTRARSDNLSLPYSAERSKTLNFARLDISIPQNHVPGRVEKTGRTPDPARHFVAKTFQPIEGRQQFVERLNTALMQRAPEDREIFIFVHGYNNNFADSVFRNAQITHDYNVRAVSLHYAWASGGSLPLYVFDRDSANFGRGGLADTIEIAAQSKARRILLVGHSMGAFVVMEALRDLSQTGRERYLERLGGVVLAAPDVDVDVFQSQANDIGELPYPFTIIVSQRDRALDVSSRIAGGHPRIGSGSDIAMLQRKNITVLNVSELDGGTHSVFASSQTLMSLTGNSQVLRNLILDDQATSTETMLADGASVIEGAASLVIYLPVRILGRVARTGPTLQ